MQGSRGAAWRGEFRSMRGTYIRRHHHVLALSRRTQLYRFGADIQSFMGAGRSKSLQIQELSKIDWRVRW